MRVDATATRDLLPDAEPDVAPAAVAAVAPPPAAPRAQGPLRDPLLERFEGRSREELLGIAGMDEAGASAIIDARAAGTIDHFGDVQRVLTWVGTPDPASVMKGIYRLEAADHVKAQGLGQGSSVLFLASAPVDANRLGLEAERDRIAAPLKGVVAIHDPTLGEIEALAGTGAFRAVWASGHGMPGKLLMSDDAGRGIAVDAEAFAKAVSVSPEVKLVIASICDGAEGGDGSVIKTIAAHGPAAAGYNGHVLDRDATDMSAAVARALAAGVSVRAAVAAAYYTVYPHDMPSSSRHESGRGGFVKPLHAIPVGSSAHAPEWMPFVQIALGQREAQGATPPAAPPPAAPPP